MELVVGIKSIMAPLVFIFISLANYLGIGKNVRQSNIITYNYLSCLKRKMMKKIQLKSEVNSKALIQDDETPFIDMYTIDLNYEVEKKCYDKYVDV